MLHLNYLFIHPSTYPYNYPIIHLIISLIYQQLVKSNKEWPPPPLKCGTIPLLITLLPLTIGNLKRHIIIQRSCLKPYNTELLELRCLQHKYKRSVPIDEVRKEHIDLITLHYLCYQIIMIIVRLVVFVPVVSSLNLVKIYWFTRIVPLLPGKRRRREIHLYWIDNNYHTAKVEELVIACKISRGVAN